MTLTIVWHKLFWPSSKSPTGFATHGGLVRQIEALSEIFDATRIVGPCSGWGDRPGERALAGKNVSVARRTLPPLMAQKQGLSPDQDQRMIRSSDPAMSVVIVTPDKYEVIRKTIRHLQAQTVSDRLEIIIVAPSRKELGLVQGDVAGFHSYTIIESRDIRVLSAAKAAAIPHTHATIIAFAEDHCFPEPQWAAAIISAHADGYAAVGPIMRNANAATSLSWAGLFLHYGCCLQPLLSGSCTNLPWHNTSYKRDILSAYGTDLVRMLLAEGILLDDLRGKGHAIHLEPAAITHHVNISRWSSWVRHAFWGGRLFAALRADKKRWSAWRRILYVVGAPLIPMLRLYRAVQTIRVAGQGSRLPTVIPAIVAGLLPHAAGELFGYAFGLGNTAERYSYYETKRFLHVTAADTAVFTAD